MHDDSCVVAIVGAGATAREHVRALRDVPGVTIGGVFSRTAANTEAFARDLAIPYVAASVRELYDRTRARLCVVCVPELAARAVIADCVEYSWKMLVEKPAGYDLGDALAVRNAARTWNRDVRVALNRRAYGATRAALAGLENASGPRFIKVQDQQSQPRALAAGQPDLVVQNWMYANSIHLVDYLRVFGRGEVTAVEVISPWDPSAPSVVLARVRFSSGDIGLYEGIWHGPGPWAVSVTVPGQRWEMRPLEDAVGQVLGAPAAALPSDPNDKLFKPGFRRQAEMAIALARGGESELPTLDDAFESMLLVARIFGHVV